MKQLNQAHKRTLNSLDRSQREFLENELDKLKRGRPWHYMKRHAPKSVKRAERVVTKYEMRCRKEERRQEILISRRIAKIREEILFGDVKKALVLLKAAQAFKRELER